MGNKGEIYKTIHQLQHRRGEESEASVKRVIDEAVRGGTAPEWLKGYEDPTLRDDQRHGVDVWVRTDVGKLPLQVKSSERGRQVAEEHQGRHKVAIAVVPVGLGSQEVLEICVEAIIPLRQEFLAKRVGRMKTG